MQRKIPATITVAVSATTAGAVSVPVTRPADKRRELPLRLLNPILSEVRDAARQSGRDLRRVAAAPPTDPARALRARAPSPHEPPAADSAPAQSRPPTPFPYLLPAPSPKPS